MNKVFFLRKEDRQPRWRVIDASGKVLGRLSSEVADILRGKDKASFTSHTDAGDYVVITNCDKVRLTGDKLKQKMYESYSGYRSGLKLTAARDMLAKKPEYLIWHAVKGMLPKNKLSRQVLKKLKLYTGDVHPHKGQIEGFGVK
ncbi:50S ribosomal protein L13 [bacterium]|nr:50S ribosomal protein L13 [bacterium]